MIEKLSELRNLTRFFAIRENALRKKRKMKCALFDTRVFVQKRCSGSTIFLHLSATSQVVGHHRGRVKGKKRKMEERSADWYANFRLESSSAIRRNGLHSAEKRANACLFVHRSYVLPHSAFRRQCLDGIFTVYSSLSSRTR